MSFSVACTDSRGSEFWGTNRPIIRGIKLAVRSETVYRDHRNCAGHLIQMTGPWALHLTYESRNMWPLAVTDAFNTLGIWAFGG